MYSVKIECVQWVKDHGTTTAFNLKVSWQCKTNRMMGFINRDFSFNDNGIILPIHYSLLRPHLKYAMQFFHLVILKS